MDSRVTIVRVSSPAYKIRPRNANQQKEWSAQRLRTYVSLQRDHYWRVRALIKIAPNFFSRLLLELLRVKFCRLTTDFPTKVFSIIKNFVDMVNKVSLEFPERIGHPLSS